MKKILTNCIVIIFILLMAGFRHHQSLDHSYRFIYPSWWHKQLIENGDYFHGLVVSQSNFSDNNIDF